MVTSLIADKSFFFNSNFNKLPLFYYFTSDRFLPDKAIDLIDEAGSRVRLRHAQVLPVNWSYPRKYN